MPTLLLINGPPAAGKSTVARLLALRRPNTRVVDLDVLRAKMSGWRDDPGAANVWARELGLTMVGSALAEGQDVVVPQLLARPEYPDLLQRSAWASGARWVEVQLAVDAEVMISRFNARGAVADRDEHAYAAWQVEREGGPNSLRQWISRLDAYRSEMIRSGRDCTVIDTTLLTPESVVDVLAGVLDS